MYTENTKITIALIEALKDIFNQVVAARGLKTPLHFDLMIETFLASKIITMFPRIYDSPTETNLIDYLYSSNLHKIRMANLTSDAIKENYTFGILYEDYLIDSIRGGYKVMANNEILTKKLIKQTIDLNVNEIITVNKSYNDFSAGIGKIKLPVNFFINCFVHPILLFQNRDYILQEHQIEIENVCEPTYRELSKKISDFVKEFMNSI